LLLAYLAGECWFGPFTSALQGALPQDVWGSAQGLVNALQIVSNGSPLLIGALMRRGVPLRSMLTVLIPTSHAVSAALFLAASRARREEERRAAR